MRVGLLLSRKRLKQITRTFWVLPILGAGTNYSAEAVSITRPHVGGHQAKRICHVGCFAKRVWIHWMYRKVPIISARLFSTVRRGTQTTSAGLPEGRLISCLLWRPLGQSPLLANPPANLPTTAPSSTNELHTRCYGCGGIIRRLCRHFRQYHCQSTPAYYQGGRPVDF